MTRPPNWDVNSDFNWGSHCLLDEHCAFQVLCIINIKRKEIGKEHQKFTIYPCMSFAFSFFLFFFVFCLAGGVVIVAYQFFLSFFYYFILIFLVFCLLFSKKCIFRFSSLACSLLQLCCHCHLHWFPTNEQWNTYEHSFLPNNFLNWYSI